MTHIIELCLLGVWRPSGDKELAHLFHFSLVYKGSLFHFSVQNNAFFFPLLYINEASLLMYHSAVHEHTLQHMARHCNTGRMVRATCCNALTHCSTLRHTATHRNTLEHTATHTRTAILCRPLDLHPFNNRLFYAISMGANRLGIACASHLDIYKKAFASMSYSRPS